MFVDTLPSCDVVVIGTATTSGVGDGTVLAALVGAVATTGATVVLGMVEGAAASSAAAVGRGCDTCGDTGTITAGGASMDRSSAGEATRGGGTTLVVVVGLAIRCSCGRGDGSWGWGDTGCGAGWLGGTGDAAEDMRGVGVS